MNFITISQYFYKLYNTIFLVLLIPLACFIVLYAQPLGYTQPDDSSFLFYLSIAFTAFDWIIVIFLFDKKIKSIPNDQGLRVKLEKYFGLTIVRYSLIALDSIGLAVIFLLTRNDLLTGLFSLNLLGLAVLWPTSGKVCRNLRLRGDEYEMVFYKKDKF
jgi:hypothetical protein